MRTLGIILAGGKSTRLYPSTLVVTKQLLPIYDKPLIYYPLSTMMLAGIRDYVIITASGELPTFARLFEHAKQELGVNITFLPQEHPIGIPDAFRIVKNHLGAGVYDFDNHALILGDNLFYGTGLTGLLQSVTPDKAHVFLYSVPNPNEFGIAELKNGKIVSLEEKPIKPKSNYAVTGLYFYPPSVYLYVSQLTPSKRGELEITDLNKLYLAENKLSPIIMNRGMVWFDTGTPDAMFEASNFIRTTQKFQNFLIGSPHEIALQKGWITEKQLIPFINSCSKTEYGKYLEQLIR